MQYITLGIESIKQLFELVHVPHFRVAHQVGLSRKDEIVMPSRALHHLVCHFHRGLHDLCHGITGLLHTI